MKTRHALLPLLALLAGCGGAKTEDRAVLLTVTYPQGLALDQLALSAELPTEPPRSLAAAVPSPPRALAEGEETLALRLPASPTTGTLELTVQGYARGAMKVEGVVRLDLAALAPTTVVLGEVDPCGGAAGCCGDGQVRGAEGCDDGDLDPDDGCNASCAVESGYTCAGEPSTCEIDCPTGCETCGDGVVDALEGCDDGARRSSDGCNVACQVEPGWTCEGAPSSCAPVCGDGAVLGEETCDDGAAEAGDGCDAACRVEPGYACVGAPSGCGPVCGDGLVRGEESCDDGDVAPEDGCGALCQVEAGYGCAGEPSRCGQLDAGVEVDGGAEDAGFEDADVRDAEPMDAGVEVDAGAEDAGVDAGTPDTGVVDSGVDAGTPDTGVVDTGVDAGTPDTGVVDTGVDAGTPDTGVVDTGVDAGTPDTGVVDTGVDAGTPDTGVVDTGVDAGTPDTGVVVGATRWAMPGFPSPLTAGTCTPVVVQRQDASGAPAADASAATATLAVLVGGSVTFHATSGCGAPIWSTTLASGQASATVYVRALQAGPVTVRASGARLSPGQGAGTVVAGPPAAVTLTGAPSTLTWGECPASPATLGFLDAFGNVATPAADLTVAFDTAPEPGALEVSGNAGCGSFSDQHVVPAGAATASVYVVTRASGTFQLSVSGPGLTPATVMVTVVDTTAVCSPTCPVGGCATTCGAHNCNIACNSGCRCQLDCDSQAGTCKPTCDSNALCDVDCAGVGACDAECKSGSSCTVECDGATSCSGVRCRPGARCLLHCGSATSCGFQQCPGGETSCPGGYIACNQACP
jgi:cysteine-rich repeat protein